eukprot:TRINITY_DN959_c0_g2_i1.p1 TRINITY_DN959_c0_g2~~TRINITY_DN959_c0_g2_i1.p1  ORF type:complete len:1040 (+),score=280.85 TRINITY_DN959_c0_g2_i1:121-3240(+)
MQRAPIQAVWEDVSDSGSDWDEAPQQQQQQQQPQQRRPEPAAESPERRVDPADGQSYTKAEFVACYGGEREWAAAAQRPPAQGRGAPSAEPHGEGDGASRGVGEAEGDAEEAEDDGEERRTDPADGCRYTKGEFVACYGGDAEWDRAGQAAGPRVAEDERCACAYCGAADTCAVARCAATGRWFCNGAGAHVRGRAADGPSHAVMHLVLSGHNELSLHPDSPLGDAQLACFHCGATNVFMLGYVPHRDGDAVVLLCRDPCLHTCGLEEARDTSAWRPLIGDDKRLVSWLLREPLGESARAAEGYGLTVYRRLEQMWLSDPRATARDARAAGRGDQTDGVPLHFADGEQLREAFLPLLELEAAEDRRATERQGVDGVTISWASGGSEGDFEYYLGDGVRFLPGDTVKLSGGGAVPLETEARVTATRAAAGQGAQRVTIRPKKRMPTARQQGWRVSATWRPTTVQRMRKALASFARDESSLGEAVYHLLLGHGDRWTDLDPRPPSAAPLGVPGIPELNHSQAAAVRSALRRPLSLIQGPPGTGKTTTAAAILYHLAKGHAGRPGGRVLACTPSNIAADHLALTAHGTGLRVLRILSQAREADPEPSRADFLTLSAQVSAAMASDAECSRCIRLRDCGGGISAEDERWLRRQEQQAERAALAEAEIVVTTCASAADNRVRQSGQFEAVLIDEATQATEPEGLIPLTQGAQHAVLIGDHCQLGPVVLSKEAAEAGLGRSTFERMVQLGVAPARLTVQYRMHPALSRWPSGAFYDGALQNGVAAAQRATPRGFAWPRADAPLCFCHVAASEELAASGTSYVNRQEAAFVAEAVAGFLAAGALPDSIGVITPYEGQRQHVAGALARQSQAAGEVEVSNVDAFQGREKDIIILSCVRSNDGLGIGFLNDPKRLNVSLTRALHGVVCVGNAKVLSRNPLWHGFLSHCQEEGLLAEGSPGNLREWPGQLSAPRRVQQRDTVPRPNWDVHSEAWTTEPPISQVDQQSTDGAVSTVSGPGSGGRGGRGGGMRSEASSMLRGPPSLISIDS